MTSDLKRFAADFFISGSAAIISKTLIAPVERAKFILQNQDFALHILTGKQRPYTNLMDMFRRIPAEQGIFSLWRGNGTNLLRYFPSQALNFSMYQYYKENLNKLIENPTRGKITLCKLGAGGLAGSCSAAIVFPLDFCQTRLTMDLGGRTNDSGKPREFIGMFSCFHNIFKHDGIRGLYYGVHLSVLGFGIYRAFYFALFDLAKLTYGDISVDKNNHMIYHQSGTRSEADKLPLLLSILVAQVCTVIAGMLSYPLDTMARHMMLDSGRPDHFRRNRTIFMTGRTIYGKYGYKGFYRGALVNVFRCTASALVLVMYDEFLFYTKWKDKIK